MQKGELQVKREYQPDPERMLKALLQVLDAPSRQVTTNSDANTQEAKGQNQAA